MERPLPEVLASQLQMPRRMGNYKHGAHSAAMAAAFEKHLREVNTWLETQAVHEKVMHVSYPDVLNRAAETAGRIVNFLQLDLNVDAMLQQRGIALSQPRPLA